MSQPLRQEFAFTENRWPGVPDFIRLLGAEALERLADLIPKSSHRQQSGNGGDTSRSGIGGIWDRNGMGIPENVFMLAQIVSPNQIVIHY